MESMYLIGVWLLFVFAIFDLIVGVSNDAVNFLNSAIWSKVSSRKVIFIIASLWILCWALFSSGMMEVARKWIFHPDQFVFAEIMVIFLAVMITDVILLDVYNTFRLPTSTTVSIVFELLWAAVAVSLFKIIASGESIGTLMSYINSEKALAIISGILLSVWIAFAVGAIVQWIVRMFFTFDYTKKLRVFGPLWWWIAIALISYFLLIKWIKGSSLMSAELHDWVAANTWSLLAYLFVWWTALLALLHRLWNVSILKIIVLVGTFGLAMAFAGNDLVNFIGVPIAWYNSFQLFIASWGDASTFLMTDLAGQVPTPFLFLFIAGVVMVITLRYSKKAKSVTETEIGLARDSVWYEWFKSSFVSRLLVWGVLQTGMIAEKVVPWTVKQWVADRFEKPTTWYKKDAPAFDLVRASVNLTVASILIALATSMKLPLSTTYVTFMVAMGTTLADGVWWRDSAVYRITWVLTVIGGWFLTALSAFVIAWLVATLLYRGGFIALILLVALAVYLVHAMHMHHKKVATKSEKTEALYVHDSHSGLNNKVKYHGIHLLHDAESVFKQSIHALIKENKWDAKAAFEIAESMRDSTGVLKTTIHDLFQHKDYEEMTESEYYIKSIMYLRKLSRSMRDLSEWVLQYIENHHPLFIDTQMHELHEMQNSIEEITKKATHLLENYDHEKWEKFAVLAELYEEGVAEYKKHQLKRIKANTVWVRNSTLYLGLLGEVENYYIYVRKLLKAYGRLCWEGGK